MGEEKKFEEKNQIDLNALAQELERLNRAIKNCPEGYVCPFIAGDFDEEAMRKMGFDPEKAGCPGCNVRQNNN